MGTPSRLTQGLATQAKGTTLGSYPLPSPFRTSSTPTTYYQSGYTTATFDTDFFKATDATNFTVTSAGTSTFAVADGVGGIAVLTPYTATATAAALPTAAFALTATGNTGPGPQLWYQARVAVSTVASATQVVSFGLTKSSGGTLATTDSLLFVKPAGSTNLNLVSTVASTATTLVTGITTLASATYIDVGYRYNGTDLEVYLNDAMVARVASPSIGSANTNTLTSATMTPVFKITPVAAETVSVDYVLAAQEISR